MKILATLTLLGAVAWLWRRFLTIPEMPLRQPPKLTAIRILCGDCANRWDPDSREPRAERTHTVLTTAGVCSGCGGRSYVLASLYAPALYAKIKHERAAMECPIFTDAPREEWKADGATLG
jgi:hypothetical protein